MKLTMMREGVRKKLYSKFGTEKFPCSGKSTKVGVIPTVGHKAALDHYSFMWLITYKFSWGYLLCFSLHIVSWILQAVLPVLTMHLLGHLLDT